MRFTALLLLCTAAGCEFLRDPTFIDPPEDVLQVYSVLRSGADTVKVLVERSGVSGSQSVAFPVSGARVRIAGGGREISLSEAPAGFSGCVNKFDPSAPSFNPSSGAPAMAPGCYAAIVPGGVWAGERYRLSVELTDGTRVTGETVVPSVPEIVRPTEQQRLPVRREGDGSSGNMDSLLVHWRTRSGVAVSLPMGMGETVYSGGRAVAGGECQVFLFRRGDYSGTTPGEASAPEDSARLHLQVGGCRVRTTTSSTSIRPDSVDATLVIHAQDSAVVHYRNTGSSTGIRQGSGSSGLGGAYGLFGSVSMGTRRVRLIFTPR